MVLILLIQLFDCLTVWLCICVVDACYMRVGVFYIRFELFCIHFDVFLMRMFVLCLAFNRVGIGALKGTNRKLMGKLLFINMLLEHLLQNRLIRNNKRGLGGPIG